MMSNCAFWSVSGELTAVHGVGPDDPVATFGPWSATLRLPPGRLVPLGPGFSEVTAPAPGWQTVVPVRRVPKGRPPHRCDPAAPVATFAPFLDGAARRLVPARFLHEKFTLRAEPTWVSTCVPRPEEGAEGWYAAVSGVAPSSRFLVRLVPHRGRLPGEGWRNMLVWALRSHTGLRLVPLNRVPTVEALTAVPAWEYRVEAGRDTEAAAWDIQVLPTRSLLAEWAPGALSPWEATAWLRWARPGAPQPAASVGDAAGEPRWADLLGRLPVADARLLVQNVLTAREGGASASAVLFYDPVVLDAGPGGKTLVRHVPQEGLPLALLSTLFGKRAWNEVERAKRFLPSEGERRALRSEALADLDRRLTEGRLSWSPPALDLWQTLYRAPRQRALQAELQSFRTSNRWENLLSGDPRVAESLFRDLDVTDLALCLKEAPDSRWRRFVTARRETELRAEMDFCRAWAARGELTVDRELDAWRSWDERLASFPLTEPDPEN